MSLLGAHPTRSLQRARADAGGPALPSGADHAHGHAAVVVTSRDELLATAVPYLEEGLRAGDLTVVSCDQETTELLRAELGAAGGSLVSDPRISLRGSRGPDAFGVTRRLFEQARETGTGRMRLFGEPWVGNGPRDWREAARYEAAANVVLAELQLDALCCYDATLPDEVLDRVRRTHPRLVRDGDLVENAEFQRPGHFLRELPLPRESMESGPPVYAVDGVPTLPDLRHQLAAVLARQVPDRERREDMHLAVSEIAANAFRHGTRPVSARVWASADWIVCTITDQGSGLVDPLAGFRPAHGDDLSRGGMGLWLARKLWDHVDLLHGPQGFTVRLSSPLR